MLIIKSFEATAVESESANSVTVVIPIPEANFIPLGKLTFAPDDGGIIREK